MRILKNKKIKKRVIIIFSAFLALTVAVVFFYSLIKKEDVSEAGWWNESWNYRQAIPITKTVASQSNVYISVTLNTDTASTSMQSDCGDFRFIDREGKELEYYIVSGCRTANTVIHIYFPSLPQGAQDIFFYYGNQTAGNGFNSSGFSTVATNYQVGAAQTAEVGPGPVGYWSFDEGYGTTAHNGAKGTDTTFATVTRTGSLINIDSNDDGSQSITVPSDAEMIVFTAALYDGAGDAGLASVSIGGNALTIERDESGSMNSQITAIAYRVNPPTGSQTLAWTWDAPPLNEGAVILIGFYKGVDTADPIRDSGGQQVTSNSMTTGSMTAQTGDMAVAVVCAYPDTATVSWTNATEVQDETYNQDVNSYAEASPTGNITISATHTGLNYGAISAIIIKPSSSATVETTDGTITGATWQDESMCVSGRCLFFDGTDDGVMVGEASDFPLTSVGTVSAWIRYGEDQTREWQMIVNKINTETDRNGYSLGLYPALEPNLTIANKSTYDSLRAGSTYADNEWHLVTATWDDSNLNFYIDGILRNAANQDIDAVSNVYALTIGYDGVNSDYYFKGFIDEVKIYPYARMADQIKQDYAAGLAGMGGSTGASATFGSRSDSWLTDGLVGYWKFDEAAGTYDDDNGFEDAADSSGNGNTGDANGNASTTAGKFGNGGGFDGNGDYVYSTAVERVRTVGMWIKASDITDRSILSFSGSQRIHIDSVSNITAVNFPQASVYINGSPDAAITTDWTHVVITDTTGFDTSYINVGLYLTSYYQGQLDDLRIYNRALSPDEVRRLYEWAPGPVAHWKFDEKTGTTAYDSAASTTFSGGNHGTLGGDGTGTDLPVWDSGKYGGALRFDNNDDYLSVSDSGFSPLDMGGHLTIMAWIYKTGDTPTGQYSDVITKGDAMTSPTNYWITIYDEGGIEYLDYYVIDDTATPGENRSNGSISLNTWHHIAVVDDDTTNTNNLYIDGVLQGITHVFAGSPENQTLQANDEPFVIGDTTTNQPFPGLIDDVRVYNYALTAKQINEVMNGGDLSRPGRAIESPVLSLSFDEGYGATAHDSSIHGNHGTLTPGGLGGNSTVSAMWDKRGKYGSAMEFDGTNDVINIANSSVSGHVLDFTSGPFTIAAWFKFDNINGSILAKRDGNNDQFQFHTDNSMGSDRLAFRADTEVGYGNTVITAGNWYHGVVVVDEDNYPVFYLNGEYDGWNDYSGSRPYNFVHQNASVSIGARWDTYPATAWLFDGLIDDVRVYNFALNADEVKTLYNQGVGAVMGAGGTATSTASGGAHVPSFAKSAEYCVPGSDDYCAPPVGEWKFDELASSTAYDTSGNGNDGILGNWTAANIPAWTRGKYGGALRFDGTDDYVDAGDDGSLQIAGALTYSAWIYPTGWGENNQGYIISELFPDLTVSKRLEINNAGDPANSLSIYLTCDSGSYFANSSLNSIKLNQWQHVAVVAAPPDTVNLYINGADDTDSRADACSGNFSIDNSTHLIIGEGYNFVRAFDGFIDQVRVYNYARTPAQIAWEYNRGAPVAHWRFDECQGGTIHDESGNGNHGTLRLGTTGVTATGTCASSSNSFWYNGKDGKRNHAGSFDGADDYISLPWTGSENNIGGQSWFTLSGWFKVSPADTTEGIIYAEGVNAGGNAMNALQMNDGDVGGVLTWSQVDDSTTRHNLTYNGGLNDGKWHYFAVIRNDINVKMYIDGVLRAESNSFSFGTMTFDRANIGVFQNNGYYDYFKGLLDDIKINDQALTFEQVKMEYNDGAVRFGQ
jgi:hypothetical protein